MFNLFSKKNTSQPFLVNDYANHKFGAMGDMPETQLVMLVPRKDWLRLPEYIDNYEAVGLAGRFGAEVGDYEWEWVPDPEAIRWWRRASTGEVSLFGLALSVKRGDQVKRGQVIARSGQTGNVNAPQLHFEIRKGASPLDPTRFLNGA